MEVGWGLGEGGGGVSECALQRATSSVVDDVMRDVIASASVSVRQRRSSLSLFPRSSA